MRNHCCKWSSKFPENSRTLIWVAHQIIQIQAECVILPPSTHFTPNSWDLTQPTPWLWYIKLSSPDSLCNQLLCDGKAQTFIQRADSKRKDSNRPFGWSEVVFFQDYGISHLHLYSPKNQPKSRSIVERFPFHMSIFSGFLAWPFRAPRGFERFPVAPLLPPMTNTRLPGNRQPTWMKHHGKTGEFTHQNKDLRNLQDTNLTWKITFLDSSCVFKNVPWSS